MEYLPEDSSCWLDNALFCIHRLLQNEEPKDNLLEKPIIKLFDYQFITATALVEQRQKLFYFLRYNYYKIVLVSVLFFKSISSPLQKFGPNISNTRPLCSLEE